MRDDENRWWPSTPLGDPGGVWLAEASLCGGVVLQLRSCVPLHEDRDEVTDPMTLELPVGGRDHRTNSVLGQVRKTIDKPLDHFRQCSPLVLRTLHRRIVSQACTNRSKRVSENETDSRMHLATALPSPGPARVAQ